MKKPTPRVRRLKKQRIYAKLCKYVLTGKIQYNQELLQFVRSPKWRRILGEAALLRAIDPEKAARRMPPWPIGRRRVAWWWCKPGALICDKNYG